MSSIRFPSVLKTINPDFKPTFTEFIDPKTNTPMVDMEYTNEDLTEKQSKDTQAMNKRQTINLQEKTISMFNTILTYNCDFGWFRPSKGDQ